MVARSECLLPRVAVLWLAEDATMLVDGLALARDSEREDARFLVSLFPLGLPETLEERLRTCF